jgi:DNA processing protein
MTGLGVDDSLDARDRDPEVRRQLGDWLALQSALALRPELARELLERHDRPDLALRHLPRRVRRRPFDLATALASLARIAARAIPFRAQSYPPALEPLADPPPLLLLRGSIEALHGPSVAIVGSRASTSYGRSVARALAADLARAGCTVVSGLARGIDAEAHRGALEAGGRTVAVLACGIEQVYPPEHRRFADEIADTGAVVGELPIGTRPQRPFFPLRNRLISGLSQAVVIVEARPRSGSLITAAHAAHQGREVFAVPGPIHAPTSEGPNALLADGANPLLNAGSVLRALGWGEPQVPAPPAEAAEAIGAPGSPASAEILRALADTPASRDELALRLRCPPEQLALELLDLELAGRVAIDRDGRLHVRR